MFAVAGGMSVLIQKQWKKEEQEKPQFAGRNSVDSTKVKSLFFLHFPLSCYLDDRIQ